MNWLESHLKVAENILDAVDKTVSKTIASNGASDANSSASASTSGVPFSERSDHTRAEARGTAIRHLPAGSSVPFSSSQSEPTSSIRDETSPPASLSPSFSSLSALPAPTPPTTSLPSKSPPASTNNSVTTIPRNSTPIKPTADATHTPTSNPTSNPSDIPPPSAAINTTAARALDPASNPTTPTASGPPPSLTSTPIRRTSSSSVIPEPISTDANSAGGSAREQRLAKLVEQLRKRLEESRSENQQLEEMLQQAEQQAAEHKARAASNQAELDAFLQDRSTAEDVFQATVTAKDVQCQRLKIALEDAQQQVSQLQAAMAALEESKRQVMESKGELEGSILEALRNDVRVAEQQLDSERKAHQGTKAQAASRQLELEGHLENNATALASMQHSLEEAGRKNRALEEQAALLQAENARFAQRMAAAEAAAAAAATAAAAAAEGCLSPGGGGLGGEGGMGLEAEALRKELSRQRAELNRAERARRAAEAEVGRLQEQLAAAQDSLAMSPSQGGRGVEAQLKEMGEMLFIKQSQLEKLAADKAAQQLVLERELAVARAESDRLRMALQQQQQSSSYRGGSGFHDVIPMDSLGEPYQRLVRHNRIGGAVRTAAGFLDSTASKASHVLRQYPLVRLGIFLYVIVLHLYLWMLTVRMQHLAVRMEAHPHAALHQP